MDFEGYLHFFVHGLMSSPVAKLLQQQAEPVSSRNQRTDSERAQGAFGLADFHGFVVLLSLLVTVSVVSIVMTSVIIITIVVIIVADYCAIIVMLLLSLFCYYCQFCWGTSMNATPEARAKPPDCWRSAAVSSWPPRSRPKAQNPRL